MNRKLYQEIIENIKLEIIDQYGSVKKFAEEHDIDRFNLSRIFSGKQDVSVGLFLRISTALNIGENMLCDEHNNKSYHLSLFDYLQIDHYKVVTNLLKIQSL